MSSNSPRWKNLTGGSEVTIQSDFKRPHRKALLKVDGKAFVELDKKVFKSLKKRVTQSSYFSQPTEKVGPMALGVDLRQRR